MELFVINRYDDNDTNEDNANREVENLENLKRKIEQRKIEKCHTKVTASVDNDYSALDKLEEVLLSASSPAVDITDDLTNEVRKKAKKSKRKKDVDVEFELDFLGNYEQTENNLANDNEMVNNLSRSNVDINIPKPEYKVLGVNEFEKKTKVKRVLPHWLCKPISFSISLQDLKVKISEQTWLDPTLRHLLQTDGIIYLFPVQETVIPHILEAHSKPAPFWPSDVCVSAPTGSGKTLTFVLPIIQLLKKCVGHNIRALIVLPVQELANQVAKVFRRYTENSGLKVAAATGLVALSQEQSQIVRYSETAGWHSVVDILVCTAGRLVEHLHSTKGFTLKHLRFLVIDEADRIMDNIQNDWLYHLDKHIKLDSSIMTGKAPMLNTESLYSAKQPPQKLLFSATLSQDPEKLDQWGLFQPRLFSCTLEMEETSQTTDAIRRYATPKELSECTVISEIENKPLSLFSLIINGKWDRILCFTNSSQSAHRLALLLNYLCDGDLKVAELSSALNRALRDAVMKKFQSGEINVLISTDALARGIDIPNCDYVISYDPPKNVKTYIHRVGRTGRAGRLGTAITMLTQNQLAAFRDILNSSGKTALTQMDVPMHIVDNFYGKYEEALQKTKSHIQNNIRTVIKKAKALKRGRKIIKKKQDSSDKSSKKNQFDKKIMHQTTSKNNPE